MIIIQATCINFPQSFGRFGRIHRSCRFVPHASQSFQDQTRMQQTGGRGTARVRLLGDGAAAPGSRTAATSKQPAGGSNRSLASDMVRSVAPASHLAKTSAPPPATSKVTAKKKTDEIFKRMLPHTIVQTYEKLQLALQLDAQLVVNGETLTPTPFSTPTRASIDDKRPARPSASGAFDPTQGRFHYALSTQFAPAALSLSAIQDVFVVISSRVCSTQMHPLPSSTSNTKSAKTRSSSAPAVTRQSWRLIASADPKLGLALYELPIGKWQTGSAVVALVWSASSTLEVARLYLQLHIPELIYSTLERPLKVPQDEGDNNSKHGLQGFTMALTLRSLDRVVWEQEWYQIDFPSPQRGDASVTVQLLDEEVRTILCSIEC